MTNQKYIEEECSDECRYNQCGFHDFGCPKGSFRNTCNHWFEPCGDGEHEKCNACGVVISLKIGI